MKTPFGLLFLAAALAFSGCNCNGGNGCTPGSKCPDGTTCTTDGKCITPTFISVQVSDMSARGCELVLTEANGTTLATTKFNSTVVGTFLKQAPDTAVTFVAAGDTSIGSDAVQLGLSQGSASGLTVSKASCVDKSGNKLASATISVH